MSCATGIGVALIGATGRVGRQTLALIAAHKAVRQLRLVAVANSRAHLAAPLTIAGPGAGVELTAAAVFADLLDVAQRRAPAMTTAYAQEIAELTAVAA